MASGVPVVAAAVGGDTALVQDRGVLIPSDADRALSRELEGLHQDPARREGLAKTARHWTVTVANSVEAMADRYEALYAEHLDRPIGRAA